jgi:hypothetical protein
VKHDRNAVFLPLKLPEMRPFFELEAPTAVTAARQKRKKKKLPRTPEQPFVRGRNYPATCC